MGRTVRLQTNSAAVLERARSILARYGGISSGACDFLWRLVSEASAGGEAPFPEMAALSDGGLSFVNVGQRTFIAVDLEARAAVSFLEERLAIDEWGFERLFLAALVTLTAPALGLTPLPAACLAQEGRGLLIFAPPGQGKTILGYLARQPGLEFHAGDLAFLEPDLRVWSGLWPIAFHEEASDLLPELSEITRPFASARGACLCWKQGGEHSPAAATVKPVSCVFLERKEGAATRVARLRQSEIEVHLERCGVVWEGRESSAQARVLEGLRGLPAHHLCYGGEPVEAARLLSKLIAVEPRVASS